VTDIEMTKACAEAMGLNVIGEAHNGHAYWVEDDEVHDQCIYSPLTKDYQAMALVKRFRLDIHSRSDLNGWYAGNNAGMVPHVDLNHAIVEYVAKMQGEL